jgi:hypothetical protein
VGGHRSALANAHPNPRARSEPGGVADNAIYNIPARLNPHTRPKPKPSKLTHGLSAESPCVSLKTITTSDLISVDASEERV